MWPVRIKTAFIEVMVELMQMKTGLENPVESLTLNLNQKYVNRRTGYVLIAKQSCSQTLNPEIDENVMFL